MNSCVASRSKLSRLLRGILSDVHSKFPCSVCTRLSLIGEFYQQSHHPTSVTSVRPLKRTSNNEHMDNSWHSCSVNLRYLSVRFFYSTKKYWSWIFLFFSSWEPKSTQLDPVFNFHFTNSLTDNSRSNCNVRTSSKGKSQAVTKPGHKELKSCMLCVVFFCRFT